MKTGHYLVLLLSIVGIQAQAQALKGFKIEKEVPTTQVKDQAMSGTCWSFAVLSFLESEALRKGKGTHDLSEMFVVRYTYPQKALNYVRTQGHTFFTAGSQCHDVLEVMERVGFVPDEVYSGAMPNKPRHDHKELDSAAFQMVRSLRSTEKDVLPAGWMQSFEGILDQYLGAPPTQFTYQGKSYTPQTFTKDALGLQASDYVQLTSYTHHPYYAPFCLESRYNWSFGLYQNVPLNDFMQIIEHALNNGHTLVFNGDVSEKTFKFRDGIASVEEVAPDAAKRQELFESGSTTVDHVMHITGIAKGEDGKKYYLTKNSWGTGNACGGYMYLSEDFIKLKAVSILVHKSAIPEEVSKKLGL